MTNRTSAKRRIFAFFIATVLAVLFPLSLASCSNKRYAVVVELYPEMAPITVANFEKLVSEGFYENLVFHRVIADFMIQGGCPYGTGLGNSPYGTIKGEFFLNGVNYNTLLHKTGTISMARNNTSYNSASSQFFICVADRPDLDGQYAPFGETVYGLNYVIQLSQIETTSSDAPKKTIMMQEVSLLSSDECRRKYGVVAKDDSHNFVEFIIKTIDLGDGK